MIDKEITGETVKLFDSVIVALITLLLVLFTMPNAEPVELNHYYTKMAHILSLVIIVLLVVGALTGVMPRLRLIVGLKRDDARLKKAVVLIEQAVANRWCSHLRDTL
jgi:uncharacterized integral membrane protein